MTTHIGLSDPSLPFEIIEGSYFEGGFLVGPSNIPWPQREEIGVEVTFPEYPGIEFSIFFDHMKIDTDPLFGQIGRFAKGADVLRKDNTTLWRNPAQEILGKFTKNGITHYSFTLNAPSKKGRRDIPLVLMHLQNPTGAVMRNGVSTIKPPITRPSFRSDKEAVAFWDAIRKSVRWRPDNRIVKAPKKAYYIVNGKIKFANY